MRAPTASTTERARVILLSLEKLKSSRGCADSGPDGSHYLDSKRGRKDLTGRMRGLTTGKRRLEAWGGDMARGPDPSRQVHPGELTGLWRAGIWRSGLIRRPPENMVFEPPLNPAGSRQGTNNWQLTVTMVYTAGFGSWQ